jgi:hypothetical protein
MDEIIKAYRAVIDKEQEKLKNLKIWLEASPHYREFMEQKSFVDKLIEQAEEYAESLPPAKVDAGLGNRPSSSLESKTTIGDGSYRILEDSVVLHAKDLAAQLSSAGRQTDAKSVSGSLLQDSRKRFRLIRNNFFTLTEYYDAVMEEIKQNDALSRAIDTGTVFDLYSIAALDNIRDKVRSATESVNEK